MLVRNTRLELRKNMKVSIVLYIHVHTYVGAALYIHCKAHNRDRATPAMHWQPLDRGPAAEMRDAASPYAHTYALLYSRYSLSDPSRSMWTDYVSHTICIVMTRCCS